MPGLVFVTVGTTKFDALISALDNLQVAEALVDRGYKKLTIQKGAGSYQLCELVPMGETQHQLSNGLYVEVFEFAPSLTVYMQHADLIISHAGSGSIFEALKLEKPLIAVANAILMDNHQAELAEHLANLGHIVAATPNTLVATLQHLNLSGLRPYKSDNAEGIVKHINSMVAQTVARSTTGSVTRQGNIQLLTYFIAFCFVVAAIWGCW